MKIGIDIDEVITEFVKSYLEFYNQKHGTSIVFDDWHSYDFHNVVGNTKEESDNLVREFQNTDAFDRLGFVEGSRESINFLAKDNEIFFITSRGKEFEKRTFEFLKKNFSEINFQLFHSGEKNKKVEICSRLGLHFFIEDNLLYASEIARQGIKVLLLRKPWNKNLEISDGITRVNNWGEIMENLK